KFVTTYFVRALAGWAVHGRRATGDKATRAAPLASQAEAGNVKLLRAPWNRDFLDQLCLFPHGSHDDVCDSASGGFAFLTSMCGSTAPPIFLGGGTPGARAPAPGTPQAGLWNLRQKFTDSSGQWNWGW